MEACSPWLDLQIYANEGLVAVPATFSPLLFNAASRAQPLARGEEFGGKFTAILCPLPDFPPVRAVCLTFKRDTDQRHESSVNDAVRGGVHLFAFEAAIGRLIHFLASIIELCLVPRGQGSCRRARLKCLGVYAPPRSDSRADPSYTFSFLANCEGRAAAEQVRVPGSIFRVP